MSAMDEDIAVVTTTEATVKRMRSAEGVVFDPSAGCLADSVQSPVCNDRGIDCALMSLASRPTTLDSTSPKALTKIGGKFLITLVMDQLRCGGIKKIFIVTGKHGAIIQNALRDLDLPGVGVVFIDLGEDYNRGFANSLVDGCSFLEREGITSFLLSTADHLFDPGLVNMLRKAPVGDAYDAVALVEGVYDSKGLPPTAVQCAFEAVPKSPRGVRTISRIGQGLLNAEAIEAGLYAWSMKAKSSLEKLASRHAYFTVAQAMQHLASHRRLGACFTNGKKWYAVETEVQLSSVPRDREEVPLFPWQARVAASGWESRQPARQSAGKAKSPR
jgi:choline kinase